jgi:hypothetical protein
MRTTLFITLGIALGLALAGCSLDPSSKPECLVDYDCYSITAPNCVANTCRADTPPVGVPDVFYVRDGVTRIEADDTANDHDDDGD